MAMVLITLDVFKMHFTRRKPTSLHLSPGLSALAPVASSPWAQSCPVQPAEHTHSPVARSQGAPLQEQSSRQPAPNLPSGHSALETGVGESWVTEVWLWREHSHAVSGQKLWALREIRSPAPDLPAKQPGTAGTLVQSSKEGASSPRGGVSAFPSCCCQCKSNAAGRRKLCLLSAQRYSQQLNARRLRVSGPEMLQT